ncbi:hypothetical protein ACHAXN_012012 [Cyclotella atomus]
MATPAVDMDQSPTSMAATAMAAAVANRERQTKLATNDERCEEKDEPILSSSTAAAARPIKLFNQEDPTSTASDIQNIWNAHSDAESNLAETLRLLISEIDTLVQSGLGAFHELDVANRQLVQSKELIETKSREATRIGAVEDQSRASLSKLLRAVEASKSSTLSTSRSAQIETRLRSTINTLRDERDTSHQELATTRRKLSLAEEELRLTKSKLNRVIQEKHSMERDSRAAISLARSLDNNNSTDMNYYRSKVGELSDKLQASQRKVGELLERLNERSPKKRRSG